MAVELAETSDRTHDISALIHNDDGRGTETRLAILERIKVHKLVLADALGQDGSRRSSGDDGEKVIPTTSDTTTVLLNQVSKRDGHLLLNGGGVVDVARDTEELRALVPLTTETSEPVTTTTTNCRGNRHRLDVGDGRGAAEKTDGGREGRLEAGLALLAFEGLDERGLLTADVGTATTVNVDVEIVARTAGVLSDEAVGIRFVDGLLENGSFVNELSANIDVRSGGVHGPTGDETAFNQLVGVLSHNLSVLARSGFALVGVDHEVSGLVVLVPVLEVHERLRGEEHVSISG